jgi:hypothetical protein
MKTHLIILAVLLTAAFGLLFAPLSHRIELTREAEVPVTGKTKVTGKSFCGCPEIKHLLHYQYAGKEATTEVGAMIFKETEIGSILSLTVGRISYRAYRDLGRAVSLLMVLSITYGALATVGYVFDRARTVCTQYRIYQARASRYLIQRRILGHWETLDVQDGPNAAELTLTRYLTELKARTAIQTARYVKHINVDFART